MHEEVKMEAKSEEEEEDGDDCELISWRKKTVSCVTSRFMRKIYMTLMKQVFQTYP